MAAGKQLFALWGPASPFSFASPSFFFVGTFAAHQHKFYVLLTWIFFVLYIHLIIINAKMCFNPDFFLEDVFFGN